MSKFQVLFISSVDYSVLDIGYSNRFIQKVFPFPPNQLENFITGITLLKLTKKTEIIYAG